MAQRVSSDSAKSLARKCLGPSRGTVEPVLRIEVSKHPTGRILEVADEITASLVVMDVSPEETWATHLRDKVYEIVSWANCPVLTVRTKSRP